MEESKRQKQVGKMLAQEMSTIFQRSNMNVVEGGMVSVSKVLLTPDLVEGRVYLSFFQIKDKDALLRDIRSRTGEWRKALGERVKNQLRRVPELQFFLDDTLDHVFRMEQVFKEIAEEKTAALQQQPATKKPETSGDKKPTDEGKASAKAE